MDVLARTLPPKYSPIRADGGGNQVCLARIPPAMALALINLIGPAARAIVDRAAVTESSPGDAPQSLEAQETREREIEQTITNDPTITETDKKALVAARRGQGLFRKRFYAPTGKNRFLKSSCALRAPSSNSANSLRPRSSLSNGSFLMYG